MSNTEYPTYPPTTLGEEAAPRTIDYSAFRIKLIFMTTIQEIESAVLQLPPQELRQFSEWFEQFEAECWDRQFSADVQAGKRDALAEKTLRDLGNHHEYGSLIQ